MKNKMNLIKLAYDKRLKKLFWKNFSIFFIVAIFFVLISTLPFFIYSKNLYNNQLAGINDNIVKRSCDACDSVIRQIEAFAINASVNDDITSFIMSDDSIQKPKKVSNYLRFYKTVNSYIHSIYVYNFNTKGYVTENDYDKDENFIETMNITSKETKDKKMFMETYKNKNNYPYFIRIIRYITIGDKKGVIVVNINVEEFNSIFNSMEIPDMGKSYILTKDDKIVYCDKLSGNFMESFHNIENSSQNKKTSISYATSKYYDLKYVSVIPNQFFSNIWTAYFLLILSAVIMLIVIGTLIAFYFTKRSVTPLSMILSAVEQGPETYLQKENVPLEVKYIIDDIVGTIQKKENAQTILSVRMLLLKLSQIQVLEAQINPHFLHNTLDTINWMAFSKLGRNNEISESIKALSEMFKLGIQNDSYVVAFSDELKHINAYYKILKQKYGDKLIINYEISKECLNFNTVKFILQPIVENSVYHGIKPKNSNGIINISANVYEDYWEITVCDDGVGITDEKIQSLNNSFANDIDDADDEIRKIVTDWEYNPMQAKYNMEQSWINASHKKGIGLINVNRRLKLIFGKSYGLCIENNKNGGTSVRIKLKKT